MRVVLHRLWTCTATFYGAFSAKVVRELARKTDFVCMPNHGSLLNTAEIERRVLVRRCLRKMLTNVGTLSGEVGAWDKGRNRSEASADRRFRTEYAPVWPRGLYLPMKGRRKINSH